MEYADQLVQRGAQPTEHIMTHAKNATRDSGVDLPELLARVEYDRNFLREIFELFREEFPPLNVALHEAVKCGNLVEIRVVAHTMTGMLASLSFTKASASAMRIGRMARENKPQDIPDEIARLERNVHAAQTALHTVCQEVVR